MRRAIFFSAALMVICLASCTIPARMELFNNTHEVVRVTVGSGEVILSPGETAKLGAAIVIDEVEVQIGSAVHVYEMELSIPEKFISWSGWGPWSKRTARLQLDEDGKVWLIGAEQVAPVTLFLEQPKGFPLVPNAA